MSDIFISYSHKDSDFVRDLVRPLEAEGFSVWWDHTIPPGRTWDDVIARGIREAKACIIVWSPNSVVSDWVKEEATLAKESGKYLPIQTGVDQPPMGFRRIQAADLRHWNGNAQDPQWRLLMAEIGRLVSAAGSASPSVTPARPPEAGPTGRGTGVIIGILGGAALVVAGAVGGAFWYASRTRVAADVPPPVAAEPAAASSIVGVWKGWYHLDTDPPDLRTPLTGTFQADGSMIGQSGGRTSYWRWQQSGSSAEWTNGSTLYRASVAGNRMTGTIAFGQHTGNFDVSR
jgi:hypothetical protein